MVTLSQQIEALRIERNLSRPALAAALGLPKTAVEKFETGRQTPTQAQQDQMEAYFGVSLSYLRGETTDRTTMEDWMDGAFQEEPVSAPPAPKRQAVPVASAGEAAGSAIFNAFLTSKKFQETLRMTVLEVLRSPEGQELLSKAVRKEVGKK